MAYIGKVPAAVALASSDVTDGIITNAKLAQDIISGDTALGAAPADTDELLVSDAGVLKRMDYSHIKATNTPNFYVTASSDQASIGDNVATQINFGTEIYDSDNAFASNTFTVPSGKDGKYQFVTGLHILGTASIYDTSLAYYINDAKNVYSLDQLNSDQGLMYHSALLDLDAGDTVKVYGKANINAGGTWSVDQDNPSSTSRVYWYGYKIIE